jgi:hypothetical protein
MIACLACGLSAYGGNRDVLANSLALPPPYLATIEYATASTNGLKVSFEADDPQPQEPPQSQVRRRTRTVALTGVGVVALYGATVWYKEGVSSKFRTVDEGWFGKDTYAGGADKLGHAFTAYAGTRLLRKGYEWAGNPPDRALNLAALTTLGTLMGVEILDGFSEKYRFSLQDTVMNVAGTGLAYLMEKDPKLDALVDFRFQYWPSGDKFDPVGDYSGQTYLGVLKLNGVHKLHRYKPLRYLELAVGYGTRGFESENGERSRNIYYGISLNLSNILGDTVFRHSSRGSRSQRITDTFLEYIQVPGTALLAKHRL